MLFVGLFRPPPPFACSANHLSWFEVEHLVPRWSDSLNSVSCPVCVAEIHGGDYLELNRPSIRQTQHRAAQ